MGYNDVHCITTGLSQNVRCSRQCQLAISDLTLCTIEVVSYQYEGSVKYLYASRCTDLQYGGYYMFRDVGVSSLYR